MLHDRIVVLQGIHETFTDGFNLNGGLIAASLQYRCDKVVEIVLCDALRLAFRAERDLLPSTCHSREVLLDSGLEVLIAQRLRILLEISKRLARVCINAFQVTQSKIILDELLPDPWGQVQR